MGGEDALPHNSALAYTEVGWQNVWDNGCLWMKQGACEDRVISCYTHSAYPSGEFLNKYFIKTY